MQGKGHATDWFHTLSTPPSAAALALIWAIPFAGLLLSVAIVPLVAHRFWHKRAGLVMLLWTAALLVPQALLQGPEAAAHDAWHAVLIEYLPFVALLLALFTAGGGILLEGGPWGTPAGNTLLLAIGTALAGVMGTTGVSMVLIHPLLRSNAHRKSRVHLVVFFILLCANIGGVTSPLGDPPLYIGFLRGVPFFWPAMNLIAPLLVTALPLLAAFFLLDRHLSRTDGPAPQAQKLTLQGGGNLVLVGLVVLCVLIQGVWHPGHTILLGQSIETERLLGTIALAAIAGLSWVITPRTIRCANLFSWAPMIEVASLFAAIFITIGPVLAMLAAGQGGPLAPLLALTADHAGHPLPIAYFWMAGSLAAVLDNAPTYLVFFQLAGDDARALTTTLSPVLRALSAGAVFFGGLTYIGNAPNMMVRTIAAHRGIAMPGFFAYTAWASALLLPAFVVLSLIFFH